MIQSIISNIRGIFPPRTSSPGQIQEKKILVYLFCQIKTDRTLYRLWTNGNETDKYLTEPDIRRMLSKEQYKYFIKGEIIFEVPESKVKGKEEKKRLHHNPIDPSAYDVRESIKKPIKK